MTHICLVLLLVLLAPTVGAGAVGADTVGVLPLALEPLHGSHVLFLVHIPTGGAFNTPPTTAYCPYTPYSLPTPLYTAVPSSYVANLLFSLTILSNLMK